jgi:hypothetical protein
MIRDETERKKNQYKGKTQNKKSNKEMRSKLNK